MLLRRPAVATMADRRLLAVLCVICSSAAHAQSPATAPGAETRAFDFSIPNIMRGPELYGRAPQNVRWTADSRWIYFTWLEPGTDWRETPKPYRVRAAPGAKPERVSEAHVDTIAPLLERGALSPDRRFRAVAHQGDIFLIDTKRRSTRRITETLATESDPTFSISSRQVFFVRENNVFSFDLDDGLVRQLTNIHSSPAPKDSAKAEGQRASLEAQQRLLFEAIRDRIRQDSIAKAERARRDSLRATPLYLLKDERITSLSVSPTGRALVFVTSVGTEKRRETEVPQFITTSGYTEELKVRTKVGDEQSGGRVGFVRLPGGESKWLKVVPDDTTKPSSQTQLLGWNDAGSSALVFAVARNYKARYLQTVSADSGAVRTVDVLRDSAWVNGPCFTCGGWLEGGRGIWFVSEADGYAHLYAIAADGTQRRQLTSGKWEVLDAELTDDKRHFYLHSSEESPFERHLYRMAASGGARERMTEARGGHTAVVSADGKWLADVYSFANSPPELFLMPNESVGARRRGVGSAAGDRDVRGARMAQLSTSPTADWLAFRWIVPDIVWIPASDGVKVPARIYRPGDVGVQPSGAGAIFVHGAGYLHNVHNYWSNCSREYMFNHFLASKGYVVLDIDYRGSAGYGRDWRTAIYRHMGGRDLQDQVDGARYLQKEFGIDPERIGIYGGSYGGFITLMALFTEPKWFGAGAALRSVTDWAHYNHPYTARILNTPESDTLAYRRSSPIYFAEGLEDPLLIAHGMVDVNVHFQDVVRLSQRLIELGKTGWEMAVYPVEDHAFVRPSSWADEYRRIFELFERHLPARPAGQTAGSKP